MIENMSNREVAALISQFRHMVLSGREDSEILKNTWQIYLDIKEKKLRPVHTDPDELEKIR